MSSTSSSTSSSSRNIMDQIKDNKQAKQVVEQIQTEANRALDRIKSRSPEDHVVSSVLCFVLCCILRWLSMSKGDSVITFTLLFNTLIFTLCVQTVHGLDWFRQYSASLVTFEILVTIGAMKANPLILSFFPILVDFVRAKVIQTVKKAN